MYIKGLYDNEEIWVPILRCNVKKCYEVSNFGRIRNNINGKILKKCHDKDGYEIISLSTKDNRRKTFKVHRLVLLSFSLILDETKFTVNHKNGDKKCNKLSNLEWMDLYEQQQHSISNGLKRIRYGQEAPNNVYDEELIHELCRLISKGKKPSYISNKLNIPNNKKLHSLIYRIRSGRHWSHIYKLYANK